MSKTYRAIRHDITRSRQANNCPTAHHPDEKEQQIRKYLNGTDLKILELFSGQGNMTKVYEDYGVVDKFDQKYEKTGDSYIRFHQLIAEKRKYDVIDLDPYGFPNRMFPDIFLLMDKGSFIVTMPKPYVNILNGITRTHLISYYGEHNPSIEVITERIVLWGLCHWRKVELIDVVDMGRLWRMFFDVKKVKATEYTGVKNR